MKETPITQMQAIEILKNVMNDIPYYKVYFTMREMKIKGIFKKTVELMRACLAINHVGLPITTKLVSSLLDKGRQTATVSLHILGDKQCLTMIRRESSTGAGLPIHWLVNPLFMKYFNRENSEMGEKGE